MEANIMLPQEYLGNVITLVYRENVAFRKDSLYVAASANCVMELPIERSGDGFFDKLKSCSRVLRLWITAFLT